MKKSACCFFFPFFLCDYCAFFSDYRRIFYSCVVIISESIGSCHSFENLPRSALPLPFNFVLLGKQNDRVGSGLSLKHLIYSEHCSLGRDNNSKWS